MRYNQFFSLFGNEYEQDKATQTDFEPEYDSVDDIIGLSYKDFEVKQSEQERYEKFLDTCLVMEGLFPQVKKRREHMLKLGLY